MLWAGESINYSDDITLINVKSTSPGLFGFIRHPWKSGERLSATWPFWAAIQHEIFESSCQRYCQCYNVIRVTTFKEDGDVCLIYSALKAPFEDSQAVFSCREWASTLKEQNLGIPSAYIVLLCISGTNEMEFVIEPRYHLIIKERTNPASWLHSSTTLFSQI